MKYLGALLLVIGALGLGSGWWTQAQAPELKASIFDLANKAQNAGIDKNKWEEVAEMAKDEIPPLPGLFKFRRAFEEVPAILGKVEDLQREFYLETWVEELELERFWNSFEHLREIDESLENIEDAVQGIPTWVISKEMRSQKEEAEVMLVQAREVLQSVIEMEDILRRWADRQERLIVLLQNPNEPRSTGGFMGSLLVIDFDAETVSWKFQDIYEIDRLIPEDKLVLTPDWFQGLSKYMSLRDANFWPDFPTSAAEIQKMFTLAGEKSPETVIAITPEWVRVWLELIGGTRLPKWDVSFTPENFDLVLQFLVESKIAGRWDVKDPVMDLAEQMIAPYSVQRITPEKVMAIDWLELLEEKHLQAYSSDEQLQSVLEKWGIDGRLNISDDADNFIYFDFISIGANKSEKFVWTKFDHNSEIAPDGTVTNSLKFKRTHALKSGELSRLLGENSWSQNVRDLLTGEIFWKLGFGENRTMLRVWLPADAVLLEGYSPSGEVREIRRAEGDFVILEIPMNVLPGESLSGGVKYQTRLQRGSLNWRPYNLQLQGTPAREQTTFMSSISTQDNGLFKAETLNIGKPLPLRDDSIRAVVEWE